jgi:TatD DNase family protein
MSLFIDTHSHLYADPFKPDQAAVITRAQSVLSAVILPNIDEASVASMHQLTDLAPTFFFPAMGLHPCHVTEDFEAQLDTLKAYLDDPQRRYYAIGETGLDLYWNQDTLARQQAALTVQVGWAKQYQLPIILHARDAINETTDLIEAQFDEQLSGIFHCFDGNLEQAARIMCLGSFKLGIGGIITYRQDLQKVVKDLPLEALVLETDSPYLPPVPHRKDKPRRNESSYLPHVAQAIADIKGITLEEVASATHENAQTVFHTAPLHA